MYVVMRPVVEGIGLDWTGQLNKLKEQRVKYECRVIPTVAPDGKQRDMVCLPLKKLNGWLFSINANRVRPDLKAKVEMYQEECSEILYEYWFKVKAEKRKNMTSAETFMESAIHFAEQEKRTLALEVEQAKQKTEQTQQRTELDEVKERQDGMDGDTGYMTVRAFCRVYKINAPLQEASKLGKKVTKMCRKLDIQIGKVPDERHGTVNSYPIEILKEMLLKPS